MHLAAALNARPRRLLQAGLSLVALTALVGVAPSAGRAESSSTAPQATPATPSTAQQKALASHLRQQGAVFYGAWWCPHCVHQKEMFGSEAAVLLPYVECDQDQAGRERCAAAQIRAFPTWELKGQRREGVLSLEELQVWSVFPQGSTQR